MWPAICSFVCLFIDCSPSFDLGVSGPLAMAIQSSTYIIFAIMVHSHGDSGSSASVQLCNQVILVSIGKKYASLEFLQQITVPILYWAAVYTSIYNIFYYLSNKICLLPAWRCLKVLSVR